MPIVAAVLLVMGTVWEPAVCMADIQSYEREWS